MPLTPQQADTIRTLYAQAQAAGQATPAAAADWLNAPAVTTQDEAERPTVRVTPSDDDLLGALDAESATNLIDLPNFQAILDAARSDPSRAASWLMLLAKAGKVTQASAQAIQALLARTQPDPTWTPTVTASPSLWRQAFGGTSFEVGEGETVAGRCFPELIEQALAAAEPTAPAPAPEPTTPTQEPPP